MGHERTTPTEGKAEDSVMRVIAAGASGNIATKAATDFVVENFENGKITAGHISQPGVADQMDALAEARSKAGQVFRDMDARQTKVHEHVSSIPPSTNF